MIAVRCSFLLPLALLVWSKCDAACYFPTELQGEFVMQSTVSAGSQVQYSKVNITEVSIPIWGHCHRRIGNNVILMDTSGGGNCIRCFHLNLRSKNVLQVRTEGLDKCYTREEAAVATCPGEHALPKMPHMLKEILLYKTNELGGDDIRKEFCPINGHFTFTYNLNEGSENKPECPDPVSELDNCPSASGLNLHFRRCSFENHDITFQCLGHWAGPGPGRERYLALRDTRVGAERRAQYRCALYQQDDATGNIYMAFSSDSTCTSDLRSSTDGFETLVLNSVSGARWPPMVEASACRFPSWSQGDWEHVDIDGNTFIYKDHANFKTSTIKCISSDNGREEERFLIFSRNQCGEEQYNCIWIKRRDMNVLEFQIGTYSSEYYNSSLCSDANFQQNAWITQGKTDVIKESPCPIAGEYTGMVPDDTGLCAKLYSDCNNPEIMFYTVSDCSDQSQVYEGSQMRNPGRFSRWRRQIQHRQIGTRIYHISNPRPITTTPLPSSSTTSHQSDNSFWNAPYNIKQVHEQGPINEKLPYNLNIENPTYNNPSDSISVFPKRDNYADSPLAQYDNSGFTRWPVGYDSQHNSPIYPNGEQPGYGYNSGFTRHAPETTYSGEEYDPWAFPKIHGRNRPTTSNYPQNDFQWKTHPVTLSPTPASSPPIVDSSRPSSSESPISRNINPTKREEREYRCLGQWEEDGLMYTYTQRRDVGNSYECFVGSIKPSNEIFIKEAGEHCQRRMSPLHLGMKLTKRGEVGSCFGTQATVSPSRLPPSRPRPTTSWYSSKRPPEPTKPWRPITGPPRGQIESSASILQATFVAVLMSASLIWTMGNI